MPADFHAAWSSVGFFKHWKSSAFLSPEVLGGSIGNFSNAMKAVVDDSIAVKSCSIRCLFDGIFKASFFRLPRPK